MELENKVLLELGAEGGAAQIQKTYKGLYKNSLEQLYVSFKDAFENLKSDIPFVTPLYVDKEIINELSEIINDLIEEGLEFNSYSLLRDWEIWLNRKFYKKFVINESQQQLKLINMFGVEHTELHYWLEKLLQEYLHFQNLVHFLKPNQSELESLLKQHSFAEEIFFEYHEKLMGWCLNEDEEQINPICGYGEDELSKISRHRKIFTYQTIKGSFFNNETNQREIAFSNYSILLKEDTFESFKQKLVDHHLKHSNDMLNIISGQQNGRFRSFNPTISGIFSTDQVASYKSEFELENVFFAHEIFSVNPPMELYDFPSARFDKHRIWRNLYNCFNGTISYGCLYDTLLRNGFDKYQSLELSGLGNKTHLRLSQILREGYIMVDPDL